MKVIKGVVKVVAIVATVLAFIPGPHQAIAATVAKVASVASAALEVAAPTRKARPSARGSPTEYRLDPHSGIPYMIGRTQYAGTCVKRETWGQDNRYQGFTSVYSYGPIQGVVNFTCDRVAFNFDNVTGVVTGPSGGLSYLGWMWFKYQLGLCPSPILNFPSAGGGATYPGWTAASKMSGLAASHWGLRWDKDGKKFAGGPPTPGIIGDGVLVYDPRLDSTQPGGSGACRPLDESTYVYSELPHLHALTYALGRYQNGKKRLGIGFPPDAIDMAYYKNAANVDAANGWKIGGVIFSTDSKWNTLKQMCEAGGGQPITLGGKLSGMQSAPKVSIATIGEEEVVGRSSVPGSRSMRDRINTGIPRYRSPEHGWEYVGAAPVRIASYVALDGGERTKEYEWTLVQQLNQSAQLTQYELMNARELAPIELALKIRWVGIKPGDCVTLNIAKLNLINQKAVVISRSFDVVSGSVTVRFQTETDAKHAAALAAVGTAPPVVSLGFDPDAIPPAPAPTDWALSSGALASAGGTVPSLRFSGAATNTAISNVEFSYRKTTDPDWTGAKLVGHDTIRFDEAAVTPGASYMGRIRYIVGGKYSDERVIGPVTVQDIAAGTAVIANSIVGQGALATVNEVTTQIAAGRANDNVVPNANLVDGSTKWSLGGGMTTVSASAHGPMPAYNALQIPNGQASAIAYANGNNRIPFPYARAHVSASVFRAGTSSNVGTIYIACFDYLGASLGDVSIILQAAAPLGWETKGGWLNLPANTKEIVVYWWGGAAEGVNRVLTNLRVASTELAATVGADINSVNLIDSATGTTPLPRTETRTPLGIAASIAGQGSGATANSLAGLNSSEGTHLASIEEGAGRQMTTIYKNSVTQPATPTGDGLPAGWRATKETSAPPNLMTANEQDISLWSLSSASRAASGTFFDITDTSGFGVITSANDTTAVTAAAHTFGIRVKKDAVGKATRFVLLRVVQGFVERDVCMDTSTGEVANTAGTAPTAFGAIDKGDSWLLYMTFTATAGTAHLEFYPSVGSGNLIAANYNSAIDLTASIKLPQIVLGTSLGADDPGEIWSSRARQRANGTTVGAWSAPIRDSEIGADVTRMITGTPAKNFTYDYLGALDPSTQLPYDLTYYLESRAGTVASGVTWTYRVMEGTVNGFTYTSGVKTMTGSSSGVLTVNSLGSDYARVEVYASLAGFTYPAGTTILTRTMGAAPSGGGGSGGTLPVTKNSGFTSVNSTTFTDVTGTLNGTMPSGKTTAALSASLNFTPSGPGAGQWTVEAKFQRLIASTWTDIGSPAVVSADSYVDDISGGEEGIPPQYVRTPASITINKNDTGLTGGSSYSWRVVARETAAKNHNIGGNVSITAP